MNPTLTERAALTCAHLFVALALLGIAGIFILGATTLAVTVFAAGITGMATATATLAATEQHRHNPATRTRSGRPTGQGRRRNRGSFP